jgi:hypothetical protein
MSAADRNLAEAGALPSLAPATSGRSSSKDSTHSGSTVKDHEKNGDAWHLEDGAAAEQTAAEKRYLRRLDWIILPAISTLYLFDYLDRQNVAVSASFLSRRRLCCRSFSQRVADHIPVKPQANRQRVSLHRMPSSTASTEAMTRLRKGWALARPCSRLRNGSLSL